MGEWTQQLDGFWTYRVSTGEGTLHYAGYVVRGPLTDDAGTVWVAVLAGARGTQDHIIGRRLCLTEARQDVEAVAARDVPRWLP